jgi:stage III sporulation protein AB
MRGEISLRLTPLPELMKTLADHGGSDVRRFFGEVSGRMDQLSELSFSQIWDEALARLPSLDGGDRLALSSLGAVLGRFDAAEQTADISRAIARLQKSSDRAREALSGAGKLYVGLGAGLCAMVAAMLI